MILKKIKLFIFNNAKIISLNVLMIGTIVAIGYTVLSNLEVAMVNCINCTGI